MVRLQGKRIRSTHLEVRHISIPSAPGRAGLVVPRYSHSAVQRNQLKRRIREIIRTEVLPNVDGFAVLVRARPSAYLATFDELRVQCRQVRDKLKDEFGG